MLAASISPRAAASQTVAGSVTASSIALRQSSPRRLLYVSRDSISPTPSPMQTLTKNGKWLRQMNGPNTAPVDSNDQ